MSKASKGENDKIYFVDGVHPIHNAMPAYGWIKKGCEQPLPTNTGRARLNINGALDPDSLEIIARADDTLATSSSLALRSGHGFGAKAPKPNYVADGKPIRLAALVDL